MDKTATKPTGSKGGNNTGTKSAAEKKSQKEKDKQKKQEDIKKQREKEAADELSKRLKEVRCDYKDPEQLSEGEIMIVIEHSDDPGRVLMSTSHDYDKYKRIASKIRQWIMRDFPSMKVIIKPNNHHKDNKRIGCFEISYFHKKDGHLERQDIFSKMVYRQWPKWGFVQDKIKKFVKNSNLTVTIKDISKEKKQQFEDMVIHVKNVLFAKANGGSPASRSMGGSGDMHGSQLGRSTMAHSQIGASQMGSSQMAKSQPLPEESTLTNYKDQTAPASGILEFKHLPVGNYAIVFDGNRTYRPVNIPFQVSATEPEINITVEVDLVEEGFFSLEIDMNGIIDKKSDYDTKISEHEMKIYELPKGHSSAKSYEEEIKKIEGHKKTLDQLEKKVNLYNITLMPFDGSRSEDSPCIPISCYKSNVSGSSNSVFEAVIEPGQYDIVLINGSEQKVLKKQANLTRGENKFVLDTMETTVIDEPTYKQKRKEREERMRREEEERSRREEEKSKREESRGVDPRQGAVVGKNRPDTTGSMVSESDDSLHNRLGSAGNRPGSASTMNKTQEMIHGVNMLPNKQIDEAPEEGEDEDRLIIKMWSDQESLPYEMSFLFENEDGNFEILNNEFPPHSNGYFSSDNQKQIVCLEDTRSRDGYYRMIIKLKDGATPSDAPVHIMVNCGGTCYSKKICKEAFTVQTGGVYLDYGVFKFPDNTFLPIWVTSSEPITSPTYMLSQIRSLINKLSESKLSIEKIFGFSGKTEKIAGESCLKINDVKKSLENFMIPASDHILLAFRSETSPEYISLKNLNEVIEIWSQGISVLDEVNDQEDEADYYEDGNGDDDYDDYEADFENDHPTH